MAKAKAIGLATRGGDPAEVARRKIEAILARGAKHPPHSTLKGRSGNSTVKVATFRHAPPEERDAAVGLLLARLAAPEGGKGKVVRPGRDAMLLESALASALLEDGIGDDALAGAIEQYAEWGGPLATNQAIEHALKAVERLAHRRGRIANPRLRKAVVGLLKVLRPGPGVGVAKGPKEEAWSRSFRRYEGCLVEGLARRIQPGEAWTDAALADEAASGLAERDAWYSLFLHCSEIPDGVRPGVKWLGKARELVDLIGLPAFRGCVVRWFALVDRPRTSPRIDGEYWEPDMTRSILRLHATILRGLAWSCAGRDDRELARALAGLAISSYRKLPGIGPRLVALGNACVAALGSLPGAEPIALLAMLKSRVKLAATLKQVEGAFDAAARREGIPRAEIEELAVPSYGMEEVGLRRQEFGDYIATMTIDGGGVRIAWAGADGAPLKSIPAAVKEGHADRWKELQGAARDAGKVLGAIRERIDGFSLSRKTWPFDAWRGRYLDHPLVGVVVRRLIWTIDCGGGVHDDVVYADGRFVGRDGEEIPEPKGWAMVSLWHPIGKPTGEVLAWRDRLECLGIRQPVKQAHREVYLPTDAERQAGTYSNRFAAHVLKQHQFHALCAARGWKHRLRVPTDDAFPPATRLLPEWGLRAEFWVDGIGEYGDDIAGSGAFLLLSTDQVRFYPIDAPQRAARPGEGYGVRGRRRPFEDRNLPLEVVPPRVFSEIMRDVDLFVGVSSVGNDASWSDGGPQGRHAGYWNRYNFGDLSAPASTRKGVLEKLVPRLKIADRCRFSNRFLVVRGDLRTYKIHIGSGNVLMEPNDQYLCIVPGAAAAGSASRCFLPFEGDGMLSIIISKALLLADDRKIKDETIIQQISVC